METVVGLARGEHIPFVDLVVLRNGSEVRKLSGSMSRCATIREFDN